MSSNLDPNSDLDRSQIDSGPSSSGVQDKKKNKKEVIYFIQTKIYPFVPTQITSLSQNWITRSVEW